MKDDSVYVSFCAANQNAGFIIHAEGGERLYAMDYTERQRLGETQDEQRRQVLRLALERVVEEELDAERIVLNAIHIDNPALVLGRLPDAVRQGLVGRVQSRNVISHPMHTLLYGCKKSDDARRWCISPSTSLTAPYHLYVDASREPSTGFSGVGYVAVDDCGHLCCFGAHGIGTQPSSDTAEAIAIRDGLEVLQSALPASTPVILISDSATALKHMSRTDTTETQEQFQAAQGQLGSSVTVQHTSREQVTVADSFARFGRSKQHQYLDERLLNSDRTESKRSC